MKGFPGVLGEDREMKHLLFAAPMVFAVLLGAATAGEGPDFLILTPKDLKNPADALAVQRRKDGLSVEVHVVEDRIGQGKALTHGMIRDHVRAVHASSGKRLKYLLLMGDAPARRDPKGRVRIPAKILRRGYFSKSAADKLERMVASDTWFGMVDDDPIPDLAVGRLPADTAPEAVAMVRRILDFGSSRDFGPWRHRLQLVAGNQGEGPMEELFLGYTLDYAFGEKLNPAYQRTRIDALPSPYCYPPPSYPDKVIELLNEGCRLWVYKGHGTTTAFGWHAWKGKRNFVFTRASADRIAIRRGAPVMFLLTCCAGDFTPSTEDCIAETILKRKAGPAAVFAASRVCDSYATGHLSLTIPDHFQRASHRTLGRALLAVQRELVEREASGREEIDRIATLFLGTKRRLRLYRIDHVHMYNLLGDPTMPLGAPEGRVTLHGPASASPGDRVTIGCTLDRIYDGKVRGIVESQPGIPLEPLDSVKGLSGEKLFKALRKTASGSSSTTRRGAPSGGNPFGSSPKKTSKRTNPSNQARPMAWTRPGAWTRQSLDDRLFSPGQGPGPFCSSRGRVHQLGRVQAPSQAKGLDHLALFDELYTS
jgi:hypothetical protein